MRCFFLVLRHTPGTPGTGFTSLLLTGGGCRIGLGARVRHTGSPAAQSRIPVIPGGVAWAVRGGAPSRPRPPCTSHPSVIRCTHGASLSDSAYRLASRDLRVLRWMSGVCPGPPPSTPPQVEAKKNAFCGPRPPWCHERGCVLGAPPTSSLRGGVKKPTGGPASWLPRGLDLTCQGRVDWAGPIQVLHRERGDPEGRREEAAVPTPEDPGALGTV